MKSGVGPCAKLKVRCDLHLVSGEIVSGDNSCLTPQEVCPRGVGEGYAKCVGVCGQMGHAEVIAVLEAKRLGLDTVGAVAVVHGHYYSCKNCSGVLRAAGVKEIKVIIP